MAPWPRQMARVSAQRTPTLASGRHSDVDRASGAEADLVDLAACNTLASSGATHVDVQFCTATVCIGQCWTLSFTLASMRRIALIMLLRHASSLAVRTALQNAVAAFNHAKVPEAQASAEWLMAHVLREKERTSVQRAIATKRDLDTEQQAQFSAFIERRSQREPVQYIVGKWAFHDVELELEPPTLIPR